MNFELDTYNDALKDFPSKELNLETMDSTYYHFKTDVFKGLMSYSTSPNFAANLVTISAQRAKEVIALNKRGMKPDILDVKSDSDNKPARADYENVVGQDSLTRFDSQKKRSGGKSNKKKGQQNHNDGSRPQLTKPGQNTTEKKGNNNPKLIKKNEQDGANKKA